jgi:predicted Zn-dependent protease
VPSDTQPLLNTGMTRDGLFLIENGEITGAVQNFRWNMSPLVGYNNLSPSAGPSRCTWASRTTAAARA